MNQDRPSLFRILVTDFLAFFTWMITLFFWGFVLFDVLSERGNMQATLMWLLPITLVALIVILWRVISIYTVFNEAQEVQAAITGVSFFRDRGRIHFIYSYQGGKWTSSNFVLKNKRTSKFSAGDSVTVLVDRNHPKKAYIKEIFQ